MAKQKSATPSYLAGRTRNRSEINFATSDENYQEIEEEIRSISDFGAIPITPFDLIDSNPFQRRRRMSEHKLKELEEDMKKNGITSAIVGRRTSDGRVQIAYGHRRVKAAKRTGVFTGYPILIKDLDDWGMRRLRISENRHREDLTPLDEAYTAQDLLDEGLTQEQAAQEMGISRGTLRDLIALLEDDQDIQELVETKHDTVRAARDLRKEQDKEIRAQAIKVLLKGDITGTQVPAYMEALKEEKRRQQEKNTPEQFTNPSSITDHQQAESPAQQDGVHDEEVREELLSTSFTTPVISPNPTSNGKSDAVVVSPISSHSPSSPSLIAQTKSADADALDRSRLKTMNNQFMTLVKRIRQRVQNGERVSEETIQQIKKLAENSATFLDEIIQ